MTRDEYGLAYQNGFARTLRFLASRGISGDTARDIAQSAWVRGWERLGQLRCDHSIHTWVNAIALNAYRAVLRKQGPFEALTEQATTDSSFVKTEIGLLLRGCRPRDRALFELQLQGLTTLEIARREGATPTAIRIRLLRARRRVLSPCTSGDAVERKT